MRLQNCHKIGLGSGYTTLFREYDPEIARWRSPDPKLKESAALEDFR